jgi:hypothetical protein
MNEVNPQGERFASERSERRRSTSDEVSEANEGVTRRIAQTQQTQHQPQNNKTPLHSRGGVSARVGAHGAHVRTQIARVHAHADRAHAQNDDTERRAPLGFDTLLEHVEKLDRKAAQQLLDQLALRMSISDRKLHDRDLQMWTECVHKELNKRVSGDDSFGITLVSKAVSEKAVWKPVEEFMQAAQLDGRTSVERRAMYAMLAELVLDEALHETNRRGWHRLALKTVVDCAKSIATIFDYAFPGYLRSGLAFMVADQRQRIAKGEFVV